MLRLERSISNSEKPEVNSEEAAEEKFNGKLKILELEKERDVLLS